MSARVLVAGGGIAGLAAALALGKAGCEVRVFERAPELGEVGAGLQLSPNAARILRRWGLDAALDPALGRPEALVVRAAATGRVLVEMPLGDVAERRWGAPTWVAHRADLHAALLDAARAEPSVRVEPAAAAADAGQTLDEATLTLADGRTASGDVVVAADGVRSTLRRARLDDGPARFAGRIAYRALVPVDAVPTMLRRNATGLWLGPGAHLVHYPVRGGAFVNVVAIAAADAPIEGWSAPVSSADVRACFAAWNDLALELLTAPRAWTAWSLADRDPSPRNFLSGRLVAVGDAAHPMLPFLAQGAAAAIEDAAVLARHLSESGDDPTAALARFRAARAPRAARIQREARRNDAIFHLGGPLAAARDLALSLMPPTAMMARYDWLYGWRDA
jgi:salicylate hydroxylase